MASLKSLKIKIQSYKKTGTVTKAMQSVSAVKMRKAQERALSGRAYAAAGLSILERLSGTTDAGQHDLMQARTGKTCIVIVTSDKGLAGSLNSAVIRQTEREIAQRGLKKDEVAMIAIGRRGGDFFAARGYDVRVKHENVSDGVAEEELRTVTDRILEWHTSGEVANCFIVYTNFASTFEQHPLLHQLVPITPQNIAVMVKRIRPAKGKYAARKDEDVVVRPAVYTIEPDADTLLEILLPKLLNIAVFHALLESKASEHSARMVAMKSATDKAADMAKAFTRTFNKVRQAAITREVSEITSGIEAMK